MAEIGDFPYHASKSSKKEDQLQAFGKRDSVLRTLALDCIEARIFYCLYLLMPLVVHFSGESRGKLVTTVHTNFDTFCNRL